MARAPAADRNIGRALGGAYRLVRLLAEGGMGKIYEAVDLRDNQRVAVKLLLPGAASDPVSYARFRREAEIATQLGHPNIIKVLEFAVSDEGLPYMVMELLEGRDLKQLLQRGALPRAAALGVFEQMGSALQAMHDKGVVHRDLKPENVFLVKVPERRVLVKLLDFGLSKIKHARSNLTQHSPIFGTPYYMAPELAEGRSDEVDHRVDVFATAVIAYQCLTGKLPFDAPTAPGVLYQICHAQPKPASALASDLPGQIDMVLGQGLAKRKADRYARVDELTRELCRALRDGDSVAEKLPKPKADDVEAGEPTTLVELAPRIERPTAPGAGTSPLPTEPITTIELPEPEPSEPVTTIELSEPEPSEPVTTIELLEPEPSEPVTTIEPADPPGFTPLLEPMLTPDATPAPVTDRARTDTIELPRRRWSRMSHFLAVLLGMGLLGVGIGLAVLIIRSVPEEEPDKTALAPSSALGRRPLDAAPVLARTSSDAAPVPVSATDDEPDAGSIDVVGRHVTPARPRSLSRPQLRPTARLKRKRPTAEPQPAAKPIPPPPKKSDLYDTLE